MVNVGILGAGAISDTHIAAYKQIENCRIAAIADVDADKTSAKAKQYGLDCSLYKSIEEVAADPKIEAVSICLPPLLHAPACITLAKAGKHILVEKPVAVSLKEVDEMNAAVVEAGVHLGVVSQNRYKNDIHRLKTILDSGLLGKILAVRVDSLWWRGACYYDLKWRGRWSSEGGGPTLNHAIHQIDGLVYLMGCLPERVTAAMANLAHGNSELEDISHAIMKYPDGTMGLLSCSLIHYGESKVFEFQCEHGAVSLPFQVESSLSLPNGFPKDNPGLKEKVEALYRDTPPLPEEGHVVQLRNLVNAVEKGEPLLLDGVGARQPIELISAIYQSASTGQAVSLPLSPNDPGYTLEGRVRQAPKYHVKSKDIDSFPPTPITL